MGLRHFRAPEYPPLAREAGQFGKVVLELSVNKSGAVTDASVVSSPSSALADSATRAVRHWEFAPGDSVHSERVVLHFGFSETPRDRCYTRTGVSVDLKSFELWVTVDPQPPAGGGAGARSGSTPAPTAASRAEQARGASFSPGDLEYFVVPDYPPLARRGRISGDVVVEFTVGRNGRVSEVSMRGAHALLTEAVQETLSRWRFVPIASPRRQVVSFHYGFSPERRECEAKTVVGADLPDVWTITTDIPPPNQGDTAPKQSTARGKKN